MKQVGKNKTHLPQEGKNHMEADTGEAAWQ